MAKSPKGLIDLVKSGSLVAIHIGFGNERIVRRGWLRSFEYDTGTLTILSEDGIFLVPLTSVSAIKILEPQPALRSV